MTQAYQFDSTRPFFEGQVLQVEEFTQIVDKTTKHTINAAVVLVGSGTSTTIAFIPEFAYTRNHPGFRRWN